MIYLIILIVALGIVCAAYEWIQQRRGKSQAVVMPEQSSCATCDGVNAKCEQECMMEAAVKELRDRGTQVLMTIVQPQPKYMLNSTGVVPELVPEDCVFKTFEDCTEYLRRTLE